MDSNAIKHVIEAAILAAGKPLPFDKIVEIFARKGVETERSDLRTAIDSLSGDYAERGIELKEVASGFRVQVKSNTREWLEPLFEERAPRYTRALLETLALVAYRQPITRAEIEEVRGVAVSSNIVRTLIERGWVRVVGHRDVPGKPSMLGTTKEFLDYFGLHRLEDLPPLAELKDLEPGANWQSDLVERLEESMASTAQADAGDDETPDLEVAANEEQAIEEQANGDDTVSSDSDDAAVPAGDGAEIIDLPESSSKAGT